jgi:uncharacterized protein YndB with AHSA1/START domain
MSQTSSNSITIEATADRIYAALTDPRALETWQAPDEMQGKVHSHDLRQGGGYEMSLFYPDQDAGLGKTADKEDRFTARFILLEPPYKIVEAITFDSQDPQFSGEMILEITLKHAGEKTEVTFAYSNIPVGIDPKDNEMGTASSLKKLAEYVAQHVH